MAVDVTGIRKRLDLTQAEFAARFGIPYKTVQVWEQGLRNPSGASLTYLRLIQRDPQTMARLLAEVNARRPRLRFPKAA